MKYARLIAATIAMCALAASAMDSETFVLDTRSTLATDTITLSYDAEWIGGNANATVVITDNGAEIRRVTGAGEFVLDVACGSSHQLEYETYIGGARQSETYSAVVGLDHIEVETRAAKAATCTEDGWTHEVKCNRCGVILEAVVEVSAMGHERQTTVSAIAPTCTADGRTAEVVCSRCGETLETSETLPSFGGHSGAITKPAIEPTSAMPGKTAEIACTRCGEVLQAQEEIPALGYIRNVTACQLWPHKKVEVCYEVAADIGEVVSNVAANIKVTASYDNAVKTAATLRGDASCTPGLHRVVWDMDQDGLAINQQTVAFAIAITGTQAAVVQETIGLNVKYYDISSSGYSTWTQSEAAMTNYFAGRTHSLAGNTVDWGVNLVPGWTSIGSDRRFLTNAGMSAIETTCRFHGKYASHNTEYFAVYLDGYLDVDTAGQYTFALLGDDYAVLYIDGTCVCKATWSSQRVAEGSIQLTPGRHRLLLGYYEITGGHGFALEWKKPGDSKYSPIPQSSLFAENNAASDGTISTISASAGITVDTSSSVKDGMGVSGTVELGYSPFADGEATVEIDGAVVLSSTNSGVFAWQPLTTGTHTLKHISGDYEWTRTVNVTGLAGAAQSAPNPPTAADANIAISSTSKSFGVNGGSGSIVTSGSGTWSATASESWITIPAALASRNAGLPVVYQVAANSGVEERTGYIYVSGHVFTIVQAGVGAALDEYEAAFGMDGGTGSFTVLADAQTEWKVRSNVDWVSVATDGGGAVATQGTGESAVHFTVAPFNEVSTRSGTITAAGCTFTVNQTGRRMKLSGTDVVLNVSGLSSSFDYFSHVSYIQVNALAAEVWDVEMDAQWMSVVDGGSGRGGGSVTIAINENPSWLARSGKVRIGTETLTINQAGRPSAALSFTISPENTTASVKGANGLVSVMATPDLPWTAASQANWLTVMPSFASGAGNGNVVYTASPNPTMANRSGTIQVAAATSAALPAKIHTVSQPGATAMVSATNHVFAAAGETFSVDVACDDIVEWTVAENVGWLSVVGSTSRIGFGRVALVATENLTVDPREANMTIAGHAFRAVQKGRTVEVEYESRVFGVESDYATIDVHPDGNVTWTAASSDPSWITIWGDEGCEYDDDGNVVGTGDHTIEYIVADYVGDGAPRTGTITIGDKTVYITQRAYDLAINPSATWVGGNAGAGEVGVPAPVGQIWNAIATEPWIAIVSGYDEGTGSGTVRFSYADNNTGAQRTGKIVIAGEEYSITQAARQMVAVTARIEGGKGLVSGSGTYDRGASVTLVATANDGYEFVNWVLPDGSVLSGGIYAAVADVDKEIIANFRRIPVYSVNGESVREGTSRTFTAPADEIDDGGTRKRVCLGTSRYPEKGTSFTLVVTEDIDFEWDAWQTNYLVTVERSAGGRINMGGSQSPATAWCPIGSTLDLTAVPDTGKSFFRWIVTNATGGSQSLATETDATERVPPEVLRLCVSQPLTVSAIFGVFDDTLATALDATSLAFTTGGDAEWLPAIDASAQTGYTSVRSGVIGAESETWLETTVSGAGTLSFRWRVDCEKDDGGGATWDRLAVFTNGVEAARIDGRTAWQTVAINCDPPAGGKTTIRWSFYRDDWDEPGESHENAAWVDGIEWKEGR